MKTKLIASNLVDSLQKRIDEKATNKVEEFILLRLISKQLEAKIKKINNSNMLDDFLDNDNKYAAEDYELVGSSKETPIIDEPYIEQLSEIVKEAKAMAKTGGEFPCPFTGEIIHMDKAKSKVTTFYKIQKKN